MEEKLYKKTIHAWCMYDWANSAFATTIMAALFPPFYRSLVIKAGFAENMATAYWGYTTATALLMVALAAPALGAISDHTGGKKRYVAFFAGLGILSTSSFVFIGPDAWLFASHLFVIGNIGFAGANVFYESLLPHLARLRDIDQISARGYALGYLGGGFLLLLNVMWVMKPGMFGMPDKGFAVKASFVSVAVWWGLFSIPLFRRVPEPATSKKTDFHPNPIRAGFSRLAETCREISQYRQLLIFLAAFWIYNDGIGTIIKMATAYGSEIGIGIIDMTIALIITQFIGVPFSFLFGALAKRVGAKNSILMALGVYFLISVGGYMMKTPRDFYALAMVVGMVQGGSQALSRSVYGAMVPKHKSAEFFGFFSTTSKFAGIAGPLLFGIVSQLTGESRMSIACMVFFFVIGGFLLTRVDVEEGKRAARAAEKEGARL